MFTSILHDYLVLFAMVNAVGNLPIFAELTGDMDGVARKRTIRVAVLVAITVVMAFAFFGYWMLHSVFEVSTASFKVAGGILVFVVAARGVLLGTRSDVKPGSPSTDVGIFPLGFPYLVGPGTIITTILLFQRSGSVVTATAAILVYLTVLPILHFAPIVRKAIGRVGVLVIARILYIFICAKAVAFVTEGIRTNFLLF